MYKVLIVEDDPMVAMINEQYIRRNPSYCVAAKCRNGKSAIEYLESNQADLIILDVYMPGIDGFETLRQIRKRQIPVEVIMVTAANDREALEKALHLGAVDYLVKPFVFERFQMALDKFAAQKKAMSSMETLNQKHIDFIIDGYHKKADPIRPKGIQEKTLQLLMDYLRKNPQNYLTGDAIAEQTGLTRVTVRRYMNYLEETGAVTSQMDYETGGRPCMLYRLAK